MMKLCKQWQSIKRNLQSDRGVWREEVGKIIWKIDNFEDKLRRKLHIKEYEKGRDKEYLSNTAFHDKNSGRKLTRRLTKHPSKLSVGHSLQDPQLSRGICK
jgi:predicted mannosyl-3-phosphoglycerate phosphatase (HAD superfamily)